MKRILVFVFLLAAVAKGAWAADDVVIQAMRDELARTMKNLRLENLDKPYFVAYRVQDVETVVASATFGSLLSSQRNRVRMLSVELRVGDYALDNTNFVSMGPAGVVFPFGALVQLPLEDDYRELRRQLWLATDTAYKNGVEHLERKRAAFQNKNRTEEIPDFAKAQPVTSLEPPIPLKAERTQLEPLVRRISALFRSISDVTTSAVEIQAANLYVHYLNSEGTIFTRDTPVATVRILARTQAADGKPLTDFFVAWGRSPAELPSEAALAEQVRQISARLEQLRAAPVPERYNGPVLFEGQAAAELFSQVMAPKLVAVRRISSDNPQYEAYMERAASGFQDRLGARILPDFISVSDNPTLAEYQSAPLFGRYKVDDDGMLSRETRLVEKGILKTLLTTRVPVAGITETTANRRGDGAVPSNLIVTVQDGLGEKEIRAKLLETAKKRGKQYGIVVRRLSTPSVFVSEPGQGGTAAQTPVLACKIFPDGHEEFMRNAEIEGVTPESFKDILAATSNVTVYSTSYVAGRSGSLISVAVPSLLFEELTVKPPSGEIAKPPFSKHPYFDR